MTTASKPGSIRLPTAPYKLRVDPTVDITYKPGTTPTLIEGEIVLYVGG